MDLVDHDCSTWPELMEEQTQEENADDGDDNENG